MTWLAENWFWLAVAAAFIGMHLFAHGGHGGHGGHQGHGGCGTRDEPDSGKTDTDAKSSNDPHAHH